MHVSSFSVDLRWLLECVFTALLLVVGLYYLIKNKASKYSVVDANSVPVFLSSPSISSSSSCETSSGISSMPGVSGDSGCAVCGNPTSKQCSRCKSVKYCSQSCQSLHWKEEHKSKCKAGDRGIVPSGKICSVQKLVDKILFPYDEFVKLFNWDNPGLRPCGLINCGNSCFANVVLQCLTHTRPLVAYLMDKGHRKECRRNQWCFLCEFQCHLERASHQQPFSPINILSRLPTIGGNLGYGKQEDAHEFMRFAVDTMQSICLDEHGGEKLIHPKSQETALIQHIFGGQLQSQVICTKCNQVSNQYENMMDLTVEIQGDAASLEECLDQFTVKEWLHGDNMYKCDGCNDYVKAWKRLTIRQAPNILTIALKRFQSGRFGKLNKKITFPENLNLSPYMSEEGDYTDKYKLYGVVVHLDMLNASFFGHYICYIKDLQGTWYRIDDCKVVMVELDDVLSQGAYMLMYNRVSPRATCLKTFEAPKKREELDRSAMEVEQRRPGNNINSKEDPTSSPVSRDAQDHKDGAICSYGTSVPGRHTHTETSSLISSHSEAHTITSEPFTKGFHVESTCSTSNGSLASDDTSYEMQQVRNPIHFVEPGHNSEDIKSENNTPASCTSQFFVAEEDGSPLTLDTPGSVSDMNGNCNIIVASDSPNKCVASRIEDDEIRLITGPVILDQIAPENDSRKPGYNFENIKSQNNVSISSSSQSAVVEEDASPLTLDAQGAAVDMNGNCEISAGPDSPSNSVVALQSESERCQNELEIDEIMDPIILDDIAPGNYCRESPLTLDASGAASNGTCKILADSDSTNNSVVTQQSNSERSQNEMKYENDSREPERCQSDMDVDTLVTNESYDLVNSNRAPDHKDCASYINNNLHEPSSSHQKISVTFQNDMEIEDNKVSESHQGSPLNGSFYTSDKRLISRTHSPGVLESGGAH